MSNPRAVRYRRLALAEEDNEKIRLLHLIADESDRGVLFTAEWTSARYRSAEPPPIKPTDVKA
jgi:hypothetical protein